MQLFFGARLLIMGFARQEVGCDKRSTCRFTEHSITQGVCTKHSSGTPEMEVSVRQRNHADNVLRAL